MSRIRPLQREDLPAVASLYAQVVREPTSDLGHSEAPAPPGLAAYFERLVFDQPTADPELPSLVYDDPDDGLVGFIASYPRPLVDGDRPLRLVCTGQLVSHPAASAGAGALLLRACLSGPQDITVTDGATPLVQEMWEGLGGTAHASASMAWSRLLRPATHLANRLDSSARRGRNTAQGAAPLGRAWAVVDGAVGRVLGGRGGARPEAPAATSEPLAAATLLEGLAQLRRPFPLRPVHDEASLEWLFGELAIVAPRGELVKRAVYDGEGRLAGWYVAYLPPRGVFQVVQVAGRNLGLVLDEMFHQAAAAGASAVRGRVDPYLFPYLRERRCRFRPDAWALVHARDPALLAKVLGGRALLTRLEGEWWMGHHRLDARALAGLTRPPGER